MQKIILDTNVIVSALIQKSYPYFILHQVILSNEVELCISNRIIKEYHLVLNRSKFSKYSDFQSRAELVLLAIEQIAVFYHPKSKINILKDKEDNKFIEVAEEANADFVITGNSKDFNIKNYKKTKILSPKDYWEKYNQKETLE